MKYDIIDKFIKPSECISLIQDADKFLSNKDMMEVLNKRKLLSSTSIEFMNLIKKSQTWYELNNKISSQNFLNLILEKLKIEKNKYSVTSFFFQNNSSLRFKKYKILSQKKIALTNNKTLFKYLIYRLYRNILRLIKYKFTNKSYVELIYDYSISPNGYKREIHRDSDSRTIVFLLYLNELSEEGTGGELEFYKYNKENENIPSKPDYKDCLLLEKIHPKEGRLVIFENSYDSLHAVNEMKNHKGYRHFLYGSFTLLGKKNENLKKNSTSLKTEFNIFD